VILPEKKPEPEFKIDSRLPASIKNAFRDILRQVWRWMESE